MEDHSLQVNGQGAALITDMTIECVPNNDRSDILDLSDSDESDNEDDESEEDNVESDQEIRDIDTAIESLRQELSDAKEEMQSTTVRIGFLDSYGKTLHSKDKTPEMVVQYLQLYDAERKHMYEIHKSCSIKSANLEKEIQQKTKERAKLVTAREKVAEKARKKAKNKKLKDAEARAVRNAERRRSKEQVRAFWPKKVYKVVLSLEASSDVTPSASQSDLELQKRTDPDESMSSGQALSVSISFSYVTREACWYPAYNVQLFTPSRSGTIAYRAEFQNATSETWRNAKIVLSTSQTSFTGLVDTIPTLTPWHVRLAKRDSNAAFGVERFEGPSPQANAWEGALESKLERGERLKQNTFMPNSNRAELFGPTGGDGMKKLGGFDASANIPGIRGRFGGVQPPSIPLSESRFGDALNTTNTSGRTQQSARRPQHYQLMQQRVVGYGADPDTAEEENMEFGGTGPSGRHPETASMMSADTITGTLAFQESSRESHGLTTTYSLPGVRTLGPSHLKRRHLIADISLSSISLSYVLIPKLRTAAFLKAQIRNTSTVTLLRGRASLTLDGTFLGNTSIPRASPDEPFTLLLGIDPAITVTYAKPTIRRSSGGIFNKEESVVYTRAIIITNNKLQKEPVELVVLDQIPVSEDEQLRMNIVQPVGLRNEGDRVKTGESAAAAAAVKTTGSSHHQQQQWGKATATLKKNGEVTWNVTLNKGASCRLPLEYEARIPASEVIVGLN